MIMYARQNCMDASQRKNAALTAAFPDAATRLRFLTNQIPANQSYAYAYLRSSSLAIWARCTSSGPSARRKVRLFAYIAASGKS